MSFIPDYRDKVDELKGESRAVINGYHIAAEEAKASVEDMIDEERLSIENEIIEKVKKELKENLELGEIELVCSLFEEEELAAEKCADKKASELEKTVPGMLSADYKERFKAEFIQLRIRRDKLRRMLIKYEAGTLDFKPTCSLALLREQLTAMEDYLYILEVRAQIEGVVLPD